MPTTPSSSPQPEIASLSPLDSATLNSWDDVTALRIPRPRRHDDGAADSPPEAMKAPTAAAKTRARTTDAVEMSPAESGTHRVIDSPVAGTMVPGTMAPEEGDASPKRFEALLLDAPQLLGQDRLGSIIATYVACLSRAEAALHVRETLDRLGLLERPVPQALAGHLVLSLANRIDCSSKRSDFLAHAWGLLGGQDCT